MVSSMRKYVFLFGFIMICLMLVSIPYSYGYDTTLNSNDLYRYIQENHINNIKQICSNDFCDYLRSVSLENSIEMFKQKYQEYLEEKIGIEAAYEVVLKGFPITSIELLEE